MNYHLRRSALSKNYKYDLWLCKGSEVGGPLRWKDAKRKFFWHFDETVKKRIWSKYPCRSWPLSVIFARTNLYILNSLCFQIFQYPNLTCGQKIIILYNTTDDKKKQKSQFHNNMVKPSISHLFSRQNTIISLRSCYTVTFSRNILQKVLKIGNQEEILENVGRCYTIRFSLKHLRLSCSFLLFSTKRMRNISLSPLNFFC